MRLRPHERPHERPNVHTSHRMILNITDSHRDWLAVEKYGAYRISVALGSTGEQPNLIPVTQEVASSSLVGPASFSHSTALDSFAREPWQIIQHRIRW